MIPAWRGALPPNWAVAMTKAGFKTEIEKRMEEEMDHKLEILKKKWATSEPDDECSIMVGGGKVEAVYMGRYAEGIVLRLNDDEKQITFLTSDMAAVLGKRLLTGEAGQEQSPS